MAIELGDDQGVFIDGEPDANASRQAKASHTASVPSNPRGVVMLAFTCRPASLLVDTCPVSFRLLQLEEAKKLQLEEARLRSLRLSRRGMHAGFQYAAARHNAAPAPGSFFFFFLMGSSWRF